jgi:ABC-2 type transport system permease protein
LSGTLAVLRRELGAYFDSPVAWVTTALFVFVLHALFFFLGYPIGDGALPGLWEGRVASLDAAVAWIPILFALLVPALTMGAWAEERRAGTDELLLTWPLSTRAAVAGKFLASWLFLLVLLVVAIAPLAAVVASLGDLDLRAVAGGVVGAWFFGAGCLALGLAVSAIAREQLVAFLLGAVLLGALASAALFVRVLPPALAELVHYASPAAHYLETSARGVLDARDLVFHGLLVWAGLTFNAILVEARRWR